MDPLIIQSGKIYEGLNLVGDGTGVGVLFDSVDNAVLRDCTISGFKDGIVFGQNCYGNSVERVQCNGNKDHGLLMRPPSPGYANENYFSALQVSGSGIAAVELDGAWGNFFHGLHCESNDGYAVRLGPRPTRGNLFSGVWLEDNKADMRFESWDVTGTKFIGGILQSSLSLSGNWIGLGNHFDVGAGLKEILAYDVWWAIRKLLGKKIPRNR